MSNAKVKELVAQLEAVGQQIREELSGLERKELTYATDNPRFFTIRRMLLLLNTHVREHTTQIVAARDAIGAFPTMPQRILGRAVEAQGELLATLVGLEDEELDRAPEPGEWSVREALDHVIQVQRRLLGQLQEARGKAVVSERQ